MKNCCQLESLRAWFRKEKRDLPWRYRRNPYRVWIGEVMLQQTQVQRVLFFFDRWMSRFPNLQKLHEATLDEVIKYWEGLGYYSRARALKKAAATFCSEFGGVIPSDRKALSQIDGFGPYTVEAVLAFGFQMKAAPVDANVFRVMCRLFKLPYRGTAQEKKDIQQRLMKFLPEKKGWEVAEAFIELGATVCRSQKPECVRCPLRDQCRARQADCVDKIPVKAQKKSYEKLFREVAIIFCDDEVLLRQGKKDEVMEGLWEFPYFPCEKEDVDLEDLIAQQFGLSVTLLEQLETVNHSFTRFRVTLFPKIFQAKKKVKVLDCVWTKKNKLDNLAFSSGMRQIKASVHTM